MENENWKKPEKHTPACKNKCQHKDTQRAQKTGTNSKCADKNGANCLQRINVGTVSTNNTNGTNQECASTHGTNGTKDINSTKSIGNDFNHNIFCNLLC